MSRRSPLIPSLLLLAGIAGLVLVALTLAATESVPARLTPTETSAAGPASSSWPSGTSRATSTTAPSPPLSPTRTPIPSAMPTLTPMPSPTPSPMPTATPSPSPTPIPLSPPFVSSTGRVAYVERGKLTVLETDGSERTVAEAGVAHSARAVAWSPDGRWLLYVAQPDADRGSVQDQAGIYHVWDSQTGETFDLDRDVSGYPSEIEAFPDYRWSPRSAHILFGAFSEESSQDIWVLDVSAMRMWQISDQPAVAAVWRDESQVLYTLRGEDGTLQSQLVNIGPPSQVYTGTIDLTGPSILSPDGHYAAGFDDYDTGEQRLRVVSLPDHMPLAMPAQPTVTVAGGVPIWSPNGQWIAYSAKAVGPSEGSGVQTVVMDTRGVNDTLIVDSLIPRAWSPDSLLLAGLSCSDVDRAVAVAAVSPDPATMSATGTVRALTNQGEDVWLWDLIWSPRGVYLAYSMTGSDADPEGVMLWNRTTDERRLLVAADELSPFTDLQWTPDGCRLYVAQRQSVGQEAGRVKAILAFGPAWEDRWEVASSVPGADAALMAGSEVAQDDGPRLCGGSPLPGRRLVAYYGTPLGPGLGILGRNGLTTTLSLLKEQVQVYRDLDPDVQTIPIFHMVTTIADDFAGPDGDYNHRVPHEIIRRWIDGVEAAGGWAVLDVQPGRADLEEEIGQIEAFLLEPTVHLAVDPEFIVSAEEVPGEDLGRITGPQVNRVQARVDQIGRAVGQRKILIIHQFDDRMIEQKDAILDYPFVELVWDADGFGTPGSKIRDYDQYRVEAGFEYGGFKLFYDYDDPLMTAEEVLGLEPPPSLVIYQ
jgi:hypothetical protein